MSKDPVKLYDLIENQDPEAIHAEIQKILTLLDAGSVIEPFRSVYSDIVALFNGQYPGYRASNTKYHNLEHTTMVALATARLIHGCFVNGFVFERQNILLGLLAALFHDAGLIQTEQDLKGTGAKYTIGHEDRSVGMMRDNLSAKAFSPVQIQDCTHLIKCTNLDIDIRKIPFRSAEVETLGKMVGSADLLAQIADRHYLEKLILLFKEFEEAGIPGFDSAEELLRKTEGFYEHVARKRLTGDFGNIAAYMRGHFKSRWDIDRDLYEESIENNIRYLKAIFCDSQKNDDGRFYRYLKRGGIVGDAKDRTIGDRKKKK
ncbi:MAG: hypothetical protein ACQERN_05140 [Thermodesulfobacteriota bacterium]